MAFIARDFEEVRNALANVFGEGSDGRYLIDVLDDAVAARLRVAMSLTTSMHDLVFSPSPVGGTYDTVVVRAPGSLHAPHTGNVRVDVVRSNGQSTSIERPSSEALAVFWASMRDALGVARSTSA